MNDQSSEYLGPGRSCEEGKCYEQNYHLVAARRTVLVNQTYFTARSVEPLFERNPKVLSVHIGSVRDALFIASMDG